MNHTPHVHTEEERLRVRLAGERRGQRALVQLVCAASILRTGLTQILPLAGGASWWTLLLCLLPGLAVYGLLTLAVRLCGAADLQGCLRACLGRRGSLAAAAMGGLLMLAEAIASLTALITLFTQGLGTSGTQLTLALLTGGALVASLHREGLPRAMYLLRRVLLAGLLLAGALSLKRLRADGLFPMLGGGMPSIRGALGVGWSLGWPLVFLLTVPAEGPRQRLSDVCPVILAALGVMLFLCLSVPHELLIRCQSLAECMLLPSYWAPSAVRMLTRCLLMLGFFLAIAGNVLLAAEGMTAPWGRDSGSKIIYGSLALVVATQALDAALVWRGVSLAGPWLLLPGAVLAGVCLPVSLMRRCKG